LRSSTGALDPRNSAYATARTELPIWRTRTLLARIVRVLQAPVRNVKGSTHAALGCPSRCCRSRPAAWTHGRRCGEECKRLRHTSVLGRARPRKLLRSAVLPNRQNGEWLTNGVRSLAAWHDVASYRPHIWTTAHLRDRRSAPAGERPLCRVCVRRTAARRIHGVRPQWWPVNGAHSCRSVSAGRYPDRRFRSCVVTHDLTRGVFETRPSES